MAGLGDIVQKAFYLGVGIADYGLEKAGGAIQELQTQGQKLADEMVARGEMSMEEARKFVDDLIQEAQQEQVQEYKQDQPTGPRLIEIITEEQQSEQEDTEKLDSLRQKVQSLQDELRRIKRD